MRPQNIPKNATLFECTTCDFKCSKNSNYKLHLITAKHKRLTNTSHNVGNSKKNAEKKPQFICECGKKYKHRQSLTNHKKICNAICAKENAIENATDNADYKALFLAAMSQNNEIMNLLTTQQQDHKEETKCLVETIQEQSATMQKTIKDIIPKIGSNNNNTTNNNNKFNLQVFLNEDCKDAINFSEFIENIQVTTEDLENQSQIGYVEGISKLFLENMKELGVNKRPIHCTDKKRNTLYIKENDEWDKEGSQDQLLYGIKVVTGRAHQRLCDLKEENPEEYSDMDSDFSNKCINIQRNLLPGFPRESTFGKVIDSISNGSIVEKEP